MIRMKQCVRLWIWHSSSAPKWQTCIPAKPCPGARFTTKPEQWVGCFQKLMPAMRFCHMKASRYPPNTSVRETYLGFVTRAGTRTSRTNHFFRLLRPNLVGTPAVMSKTWLKSVSVVSYWVHSRLPSKLKKKLRVIGCAPSKNLELRIAGNPFWLV